MSEEQPSYFAIIPANVRYDNRLKAQEKIMYGEITVLANKYGYCTAGNAYFAKLYERSNETISRWIGNLIKCGYAEKKVIRDENQKVIQRRIYLVNTLPSKMTPPSYQKRQDPTVKNVKENSTSINNTSNNNATTTADIQNSNSELKDKFTAVLTFYQNNIGVLNPITTEDIMYWCNDLSPEVVTEAIRRTAQSNKNWRYTTGILRDWVKHNIKTLDQIKASDIEFQKKKETKYSSYKKPKKEGHEDGARW